MNPNKITYRPRCAVCGTRCQPRKTRDQLCFECAQYELPANKRKKVRW